LNAAEAVITHYRRSLLCILSFNKRGHQHFGCYCWSLMVQSAPDYAD